MPIAADQHTQAIANPEALHANCRTKNFWNYSPELGGQDAQATMRFVLAVADAPRVDVFIDKKLAVSQLIPSEFTPSIPLLADKHLIEVVAANQALISQNLLLTQSIELEVRETVIGVLMGARDKLTFVGIAENIEPLQAGQGSR